jgi:hypothetical protein
MSFDAKIINIFISSPGDVIDDRCTAISSIHKWNQRNGQSRRIFFNHLIWEDLVAPDIGKSGQDVINTQVGNSYDIFLGLMWSRFGTPTTDADSGTEEEFNRAVERYHKDQVVTISFLFKNSPIPQSILYLDQYSKVQGFKKIVSDSGCLYREYSDEISLAESINIILDRASNQMDKLKHYVGFDHELTDNEGGPGKAEPLAVVATEAELGLFDYQ